jgi:hypothetical protein
MKLRGEHKDAKKKTTPSDLFLSRFTLSRLSCGVLDLFQSFGRLISILP